MVSIPSGRRASISAIPARSPAADQAAASGRAQLGDVLVVEPVVTRPQEAGEVVGAHLLGGIAFGQQSG
jgi:hypothetical protein